MKTGEKQIYVSPKKRIVCNIVDAVIILAAVAVAVLCRLGIIPWHFSAVISGIVLAGLGLVFFANALIQWNSVSMWIAFCFIVPSAVSFACRAGAVSYAAIYPVYIALPGIACLGTMIISREFARLIKAALIFLVAGAVFLLETCGVLSIGWTLAVLFVYLAALAAAFIVYLNKGEKK